MSLRTKRSNLIYKGSSGELKTQLHISKEVGYLSEEAFQELNSRAEKIAGMVGSLSRFSRLQPFSLVSLTSFSQIDKPDKPDKPNQRDQRDQANQPNTYEKAPCQEKSFV